jgi:hypothetical protein
MEAFVLALHPIVEDVAQFEGFVTKLIASTYGLFLVEIKHSLLRFGLYLYIVVGTLYIVETFPLDGY